MVFAKVPGTILFYSERYGGRPYNNCMIDAAMTGQRWVGYDVKDGDDDFIRQAIPAPDYTPSGQPVGLSFVQLQKGLTACFPVPLTFGFVAPVDLQSNLKLLGHRGRKKAVYTVAVPHMSDLPDEYRKWCGLKYVDGHAFAIVARQGSQVYILDPMEPSEPPPGADATWQPGELIDWNVLYPALLKRTDGAVRVAYGFKNTAT